MKLDVDTLGTFYEMARDGAGLAADRFSSMTDIPARVNVTHLNFTRKATISRDLAGADWVGIQVTLSDELGGTSVLLFDRESADVITDVVTNDLPTVSDRSLSKSAVMEIGQTMNNAFVDGWANVLDRNIDVSAPTYVDSATTGEVLHESLPTPTPDELAVMFRSTLEAVGTDLRFRHYLLLDADTLQTLFHAETADRAIEVEKLVGFDRLAHRGATQAAANLTQMSGVEMDVDIRRINFISLDAIPSEISAEPMIGVAFGFTGILSGYLLFLFDETSAQTLVHNSLETDGSPEFGTLERDALEEMSNVMASGLLDGWANLIDTTIDHSPPAYAHDMGAAVVDPLVVGLSETQEFAFIFDTCIKAVDTEVHFDIYVIPDEADLREALDAFKMSHVADTQPEAATDLPDEHVDLEFWETLSDEEIEPL